MSGFFLGLSPLLGAVLFGVLLFKAMPNAIGVMGIILIAFLAIWLGVLIFRKIQTIGLIEFLTIVHSSPELDHLELTPDSTTRPRQAEELAMLIGQRQNLCRGGSIRIFGDWYGKPHRQQFRIESAGYDSVEHMLVLVFSEGLRLEIYQPKHIHDAPAFLKIMKAEKIKLVLTKKHLEDEKQFHLTYYLKNHKILTDTNIAPYKRTYDVSLSAPALMIYGHFDGKDNSGLSQ